MKHVTLIQVLSGTPSDSTNPASYPLSDVICITLYC